MYNNIRKHVHRVLVEISADTWPTYMYQPTYPLTFKLPLEWQTCGRNLANQLYWHSVNNTVTWSALVIEFYLMNSAINLFFLAPWISSFMSPVSRGGLETVIIPEKQWLTIHLNVQQSTDTPLTLDWNAADCWWQHSNWGVGQVSTNRSNWWSSNLINMTSEYWPI